MAISLLLIGGAIGSLSLFDADRSWIEIPITAMLCLMVGALLWAIYYFIVLPSQSRKVFSETAALKEEQSLTLVEGGVDITQSSSQVSIVWNNMVCWSEDKRYFVIYANRMLGYIFPKDKVPPLFINDIRASLIQSGLPEKGKRRK